MSTERPYRPCVGIALFNTQNEVFVGERINSPGAWQMPQGGIDDGETAEQAFFREMLEEIGTDQADILKVHDKKLRYDLPSHLATKFWDGQYAGQEQTWIAARFTGIDTDINIASNRNQEFRAWKWVALSNVLSFVVPFKRETYKEVIEAFEGL